MIRTISLVLQAAVFITAGVLHFVKPRMFIDIVPSYLPAAAALVYISGVAEIAGGVGLLIPPLRVAAGWGLLALLLAVFPANVHMALNRLPFDGKPVPDVMLWLRLPGQFVLMVWIWWAAVRRPPGL